MQFAIALLDWPGLPAWPEAYAALPALIYLCALLARPSAGANPTRQLSLQPVAIGAGDGGNVYRYAMLAAAE